MAFSRYMFSKSIKGGKGNSSPANIVKISRAVDNGLIAYAVHIVEGRERLDQLAGIVYNDSSYWWIIAAASKIGWGLQITQGTVLRIPKRIDEVLGLLS